MARKRNTGTRRSDYNKRRKGVLSVVLPWIRRFGITVVVLVGILWVGSWLYLSGTAGRVGDWTKNEFLAASADAGFAVENILLEGRVNADASTILAMVNLQKGDPLFALDPRAAKDLISQIGWVEGVQVERRLPNTVYIGIKERAPLALWQSEKRMKLLDTKGEIITTGNLQRFADLVMLTGADAPEHAPVFIQTLKAEPEIYERVETASRIGERRWDLKMKNGVAIKLPELDIGLALERLSAAHKKDGLLDRDVQNIDMRELDRISVRTKPGQVTEYQNALKIEAATKSTAGNDI